MDQQLYQLIINSAAQPTSIAKIAESVFNGQYKVHIIERKVTWYEKYADSTYNIIDDVVIRRRLSSDIVNSIILARERFKKTKDSELTEDDISTNNDTMISLHASLTELMQKRKELREQNKIDEVRLIDSQIQNTEDTLQYISNKHELYRADKYDKIYSVLLDMENKLYDPGFKIKIVKELVDMLYQPNN